METIYSKKERTEEQKWYNEIGEKLVDGVILKVITFRVTPYTISKFRRMKNARVVREPEVKEIKRFMKKTHRFPLGPDFFINMRENGLVYIIDGNHRLTAASEILSEEPNFSFEGEMIALIGNRLTQEQEISIFMEINRGVHPSTMDKAKMMEIPFPMELVRKSEEGVIPFKITWTQPGSSIKSPVVSVNILSDAVVSIGKPYSTLPYSDKKLEILKKLPDEMIQHMINFCIDMGEVFREKDAIFYRNRAPTVLFRIWYLNVVDTKRFSRSEIKKRWMNLITAPEVYETLMKLYGVGVKSPHILMLEDVIVKRMNSRFREKIDAPLMVWG